MRPADCDAGLNFLEVNRRERHSGVLAGFVTDCTVGPGDRDRDNTQLPMRTKEIREVDDSYHQVFLRFMALFCCLE